MANDNKSKEDKEKDVEKTIKKLKSRFGDGAIMRLSEDQAEDVEVIPTGSMGLDEALGVGGIPRGRIAEIFGPEASGKTTLALHIIAEAQKQDGIAAFVDAEHALDPEYAQSIGVKLDELLISQPNTGEEALEITESLVRSGDIDLVVVDSVSALTPKEEIEGDMGKKHVGHQARLMSQAMRKLTSGVSKTNTTVIFINQIRMKIGVMFGNPETTSGGRALKFYSSVRLDIRRRARIKKDDEVVGSRTKVKVVKNKVASPFQETEFDIMYGEGISKEGELIALGEKYGIIEKAGSWYSFAEDLDIDDAGETIGQGYNSVRTWLKEHDDEREYIEKEIRQAMQEEGRDSDEDEEESEDDGDDGNDSEGNDESEDGEDDSDEEESENGDESEDEE
ncbi:MAG: recombinase RecA [Parcubacteria group bacterium SW_6_46_9]|nr:MAG: recombinase RecA [Parcubacteria group bacterium SW_6_46_9]